VVESLALRGAGLSRLVEIPPLPERERGLEPHGSGGVGEASWSQFALWSRFAPRAWFAPRKGWVPTVRERRAYG